jgi:tetratricopeptide (TPR) repeat protein
MTKKMMGGMVVFAAAAIMATAQTPKSQDEVKALMEIQQAQQPDDRIKAVEALIQKFKDTEFKSWAFSAAGDAAQMKRDNSKAIFYYEQALKADPKGTQPMLMLGGLLAQTTRENDLDKEEKLAKAEKYVKTALEMIPDAPKPNPQITDEQWAAAKKEDVSLAHVDLGMIASVRKKYDVAITEFKAAVDGGVGTDPGPMIRLAGAYSDAGKPDDAIAMLDKVLAIPNLNASYKNVADQEKARATKLKTAK